MMADAAAHLDRARALLGLLEQEAHALRSGDGAALKAVCFDKIAHLRQLETLLAALGKGAGGMDPQQRRALAALLQQCLQLTGVNEALLHSRMNRARNALQQRRGIPANYDASGSGRYELQRTLRSVA
jgi:flagellar biosynthesis/type III secretory pathway chaperone